MPKDDDKDALNLEEWKELIFSKSVLDWDKWNDEPPRACNCSDGFIFRLDVDSINGVGQGRKSSSLKIVDRSLLDARKNAGEALMIKYADLVNRIPNLLNCESPCKPAVSIIDKRTSAYGGYWVRSPNKGWWKKHAPFTPAGGRHVYVSKGSGTMFVLVVCV